MNGVMLVLKGQAERVFIGSGLGIIRAPFQRGCHFDMEVVDGIGDFTLSGFSDKERTDWLVVVKWNSQGSVGRENAVVVGMTMLRVNA
jgi:hypothetical protein